MLDTEDVDVDLFTPASGISLASIFKVSQAEVENDTASLKYIPEQPPMQSKLEEKSKETKQTECVFACASNVYEWTNNVYTNKGKLGFGIIKSLKNETCNFVLYNANKTTLSYATFSPTFEVHVKKPSCISYYDNAQKYWSVYAKDYEIEKVLGILKDLNVTVKQSEQGNPPAASSSNDNNQHNMDSTQVIATEEKSDTDSSINKKTKDSIIKRMASMGQSVLPYTKTNFVSTDSSDSNESVEYRRQKKHKPIKSIIIHNENDNDKRIQEDQGKVYVKKSISKNKTPYGTNSNEDFNDFVPSKSLKVVSTTKNDVATLGMSDVSLLISEQRVSNSELRINLNRISDKLDMVIGKIDETSSTGKESSGSNYQNVIIQKLLNEYETKIKNYEEFIQANGLGNMISFGCKNNGKSSEETEREISQLKEEIKKLNLDTDSFAQKEKSYLEEIAKLKKDVDNKDEQLLHLTKNEVDRSKIFQKSDDAKSEIKSLMNDTFQSIAANFRNEESYTGTRVKSIVAAVIKKTTIDSISNL